MLTTISRLKDRLIYGIPVAVAVFMMSETEALAAGGIGDAAKTVNDNLDNLSDLVLAGSFLGGLVLSAAGLLKLKQASESQGQQVRYGEGVWRLAVGIGLTALPAVIKMGAATADLEDGMTGKVGTKF